MEGSKLVMTYVCVKNMKRAVKFYEKLLNKKIVNRFKDRWADFDTGKGFSLGLYNPAFDKGKYSIGSNVILNFQTKDIKKELERIRKFAPELTKNTKIYYVNFMQPYYFISIKDTEGNRIEIAQFDRKKNNKTK